MTNKEKSEMIEKYVETLSQNLILLEAKIIPELRYLDKQIDLCRQIEKTKAEIESLKAKASELMSTPG